MDVEDSQPEFLSVRDTAKRLGVHENTVRNWARAGQLPTARLPGSRFHRFDARDVDRLLRQRGATIASVERERLAIGPELVNATQLGHWADTRDAQDTFPELIRRLLAATPGVTNVSVRSGEGVSAPGWDGRATSSGTAYLPDGELRLEFGVGAQPKAKADDDFEKRRDHPTDSAPADVKFIFVTPRRYRDAADWAESRRKEGVFGDVRFLDADDLEGWLQATPAAHYWISEHLGRRPRDAQTLEQWWDTFSAQTAPELPAELFLTGRDAALAAVTSFLRGPAGVISVQAPWRSEALAFLATALQSAGEVAQPALIVRSAEAWDRVVAQPGRTTLVPVFDDPNIALAVAEGHHVVLPIGQDQVARGTNVELPRPHRQGATAAFEAVSVASDRAYELAGLARRSMPSLVRTLARDPRLARPPWSELPAAAILAPLMLVGAWTTSEADTAVVARMVEKAWPDIERALLAWAAKDDPPYVRPSSQWHLASAEEAFLVLRDSLTVADLERWHDMAVDVLLEADPRLGLSIEEQPMAGVLGATRAHSPVLRRGLAQGVALIGAMGNRQLNDGVAGEDHARRLVREILSRANADASGEIWRSLEDVLPLLAEAAPQVFLDAVHDDLDRAEPLLKTMFQDSDRAGSVLYSSSPHTGLLWALETLCWSPEYLLSATSALARLHAIDPGGRLSNRPLESLTSVLVGWIRQTSAPLDQRVLAVENICERFPDTGWELVLALWPSHHAVSSPPSTPRFHDWKPESRSVPVSEYIAFIGCLVQRAIRLAGTDAVRWSALVGVVDALPRDEQAQLLDAVEATFEDADTMDPAARLVLWDRTHKEVARHQRFSSADWSMAQNPDNPLARMQKFADRLEPTAHVERFGYLFDWRPDLPGMDLGAREAYEQRLLQLRTEAVSETLRSAGLDGLRALAERSPAGHQLGWVLGSVASEELTPDLLAWLDSADPKQCEVAGAWAQRKLLDEGATWLRLVLARPEAAPSERRERLALNAPATSEVWDALIDVDADLNTQYWKGMNPWRVKGADAERATLELLAHDRPWVAIDLLAGQLHVDTDPPPCMTRTLVTAVLDAALQGDPNQVRSQSLGYELGLLLDYLERQGEASSLLAQYEFLFFRLLDHHRNPRALFAQLAQEPSQFVALVERVYRGKQQPRRQLNEQEEALAQHAWWVLAHWTSGFPGEADDSRLDGEQLRRWVRDARDAFAESDRADIGDEQIGQVLARGPVGTDGIWPAEAVRELLEEIGSQSIETGIHVGVYHQRGVTSRGVYDGGQQERDVAAKYREWERQTAGRWRRTNRLLRELAESFERDAQREDDYARVTSDTE